MIAERSRAIMGVMLESNIEAGIQLLSPGQSSLGYGVSVTDPCIDWPTTERCILDDASALGTTRAIASAGHCG